MWWFNVTTLTLYTTKFKLISPKSSSYYDETLIIGQGEFSIVYKEFLPHSKIVAIKKSKIGD